MTSSQACFWHALARIAGPRRRPLAGRAEQTQENECLDGEAPPERPACEIGYDWAEVCDNYFAGLGTQIMEGCGYTWIRGLYADSQRNTIIDEEGIVVFQEWRDPLSTINPHEFDPMLC